VRQGTDTTPCECSDLCQSNGFHGVVRNNTNHFNADCYCIAKFTERNNDTSLKSKPIWQYESSYTHDLDVITDNLLLGISTNVYSKEKLGVVSSSVCYDMCLSKGADASTFEDDLQPGQDGDCWCDYGEIVTGRKTSWSVALHNSERAKENPILWKADVHYEQ